MNDLAVLASAVMRQADLAPSYGLTLSVRLSCSGEALQTCPLTALSFRICLLQYQGSDVSCSSWLLLSSAAASVQAGAGGCQDVVKQTL